MSEDLSESRLHMWRGVVAMAHADGVVTPHELSFINEYMKKLDIPQAQLDVIGQDILHEQDIDEVFSKITERQDKIDFFALARALSWCDGDFDAQEKRIIDRLESVAVENQEIVKESRDICSEVELCDNQWNFKTERSKSLLGFLTGLTKQAA